ncbi:hypothetical protein [Psychrobacter namhaensis]|uniref:hypothetical protein n=1 Tax=Psychrobacter namhaensis TaxID=292734 RepID=UPI003D0447AA
MNNTSNNVIKRQLIVIQYLIESNYVSTTDIQTHLKSKGIDSQIRTIQRDLNLLSEIVPLEVRTEDKPYSWRWKRLKNASVHTLSTAQILALRIVETELKGVIPDYLYEQLQPLFIKSHFISGLSQIDESIENDNRLSPKMDFMPVSPLQRIAMNMKEKKLYKKRILSIFKSKKNGSDKLTDSEKNTIKSLVVELENYNLNFLCEMLNRNF